MNSELLNILIALGSVLITSLGFWLKSVLPNWIKFKQDKDLKELQSNLEIKNRNSIEEHSQDKELVRISSDIIKNLPELKLYIDNAKDEIIAEIQNQKIKKLDERLEKLEKHE
jgi:hypothetical protein